MSLKIVYVAHRDVSVYESQVLELLHYLQLSGIDITLMQGYKNKNEMELLERKLSKYPKLPVTWVKSYPGYSLFEKKTINNYYHSLCEIEGYEDAIIHVRSEFLGMIFKKITLKYDIDFPILIDIRGVVYEELLYKIGHANGLRRWSMVFKKKYFKKIYEDLFCHDNCSIFITSVSTQINEYIQNRYPSCNYSFTVHPNIAGSIFKYSSQKRKEIRDKLGISDDQLLAICATGGNSLWQRDHLVIQRLLDLGIKVINLSRKDVAISGCMTKFVPFEEMPSMLSAADIAVLWRENIFINHSASPSKFSEFASMGLFVIHNNSVRIAQDYILRTKAGYLTEEIEDISSHNIITSVICSNRQDWYKNGQEEFGIKCIGKSYVDMYKLMLLKNRKYLNR